MAEGASGHVVPYVCCDQARLASANVGVIVVSYNSAAHLPRFLDSMDEHADGLSLRVIVVGDNSTDDSVAVAEHQEPIFDLLSYDLGDAGAINVGCRPTDGCDAVLGVERLRVWSSSRRDAA